MLGKFCANVRLAGKANVGRTPAAPEDIKIGNVLIKHSKFAGLVIVNDFNVDNKN